VYRRLLEGPSVLKMCSFVYGIPLPYSNRGFLHTAGRGGFDKLNHRIGRGSGREKIGKRSYGRRRMEWRMVEPRKEENNDKMSA
jgi:hypothetical protein